MPQEQLGTIYPFFMMIVVFVFFYFFAIRPQKKREKQMTEMRNALKVGDRVVTIGGIRGKVTKVGTDYLTLEVSNQKTTVEFMKWAVGSVENVDETTVAQRNAASKETEVIIKEDAE